MEVSIRDALTASGEGPKALWAKFDAAWYKKAYSDALGAHDPLEFYLRRGAKLGRTLRVAVCRQPLCAGYPELRLALLVRGRGFATC